MSYPSELLPYLRYPTENMGLGLKLLNNVRQYEAFCKLVGIRAIKTYSNPIDKALIGDGDAWVSVTAFREELARALNEK